MLPDISLSKNTWWPDLIISYISGAERLVHSQPLPLTQGEEGAGRGDGPHHHAGLQLVQEQEAERPSCRDLGVSWVHLSMMTVERSLKSSSVTTSRVVTALFVVLWYFDKSFTFPALSSRLLASIRSLLFKLLHSVITRHFLLKSFLTYDHHIHHQEREKPTECCFFDTPIKTIIDRELEGNEMFELDL